MSSYNLTVCGNSEHSDVVSSNASDSSVPPFSEFLRSVLPTQDLSYHPTPPQPRFVHPYMPRQPIDFFSLRGFSGPVFADSSGMLFTLVPPTPMHPQLAPPSSQLASFALMHPQGTSSLSPQMEPPPPVPPPARAVSGGNRRRALT